jgi:hypothetical protein
MFYITKISYLLTLNLLQSSYPGDVKDTASAARNGLHVHAEAFDGGAPKIQRSATAAEPEISFAL